MMSYYYMQILENDKHRHGIHHGSSLLSPLNLAGPPHEAMEEFCLEEASECSAQLSDTTALDVAPSFTPRGPN